MFATQLHRIGGTFDVRYIVKYKSDVKLLQQRLLFGNSGYPKHQ